MERKDWPVSLKKKLVSFSFLSVIFWETLVGLLERMKVESHLSSLSGDWGRLWRWGGQILCIGCCWGEIYKHDSPSLCLQSIWTIPPHFPNTNLIHVLFKTKKKTIKVCHHNAIKSEPVKFTMGDKYTERTYKYTLGTETNTSTRSVVRHEYQTDENVTTLKFQQSNYTAACSRWHVA